MSEKKFDWLSEVWKLKDLTVEDAFKKINENSDLKFLITIYGLAKLITFLVVLLVGGNIFYLVLRSMGAF